MGNGSNWTPKSGNQEWPTYYGVNVPAESHESITKSIRQ